MFCGTRRRFFFCNTICTTRRTSLRCCQGRISRRQTYVHAVNDGAAAIRHSLMASLRSRQPAEDEFAWAYGEVCVARRTKSNIEESNRFLEREDVGEDEFHVHSGDARVCSTRTQKPNIFLGAWVIWQKVYCETLLLFATMIARF